MLEMLILISCVVPSLAIDVPFCDERSKVDGFCCLHFADAVSDDTELDFEIVHQTSEQHL